MAVILLQHVVEVLVGPNRDKGIKIFRKDLVLDHNVRVVEHAGYLFLQPSEGDRARDGQDAGLTANILELAIRRAREDFAAITA